MRPVIAVFGSGQIRPESPEYDLAYQTGYALAQAGFDLCNGGYTGAMEASAHGAKEAGGRTIGVISSQLGGTANSWTDEVRVAPTWRDRLFTLIDLPKGYVVLDGATGTLVEFFTVWEMANKKLHHKPIVLAGHSMQAFFHYVSQKEDFIVSPWIHTAASPEAVVRVLKSNLK